MMTPWLRLKEKIGWNGVQRARRQELGLVRVRAWVCGACATEV
jgi:hypothetical protein